MTSRYQPIPWAQPGWSEQAAGWIGAQLAQRGIAVTGPIEQPHVRPWSTVLRVPTGAGDIYFKATTPALAHEPALTQALARWRPDCIAPLLAADLERGWMLMPDGGATLRSVIRADRDLEHWERLLPIYAGLQIDLAARRDELLALGVLDRRLAVLPARYQALLADRAALLIDQPDGLTSEEYGRLIELAPQLDALCERLAGYGLPETLQHDDFHDGNIFIRDGRYIFFDWGESGVGHPFYTLVVTLRSIAYSLELDEGAAEMARLRDAYLEPWTRYEPRARLREALGLALRVGRLCRALTWHHVVSQLDSPHREENADAVPGWLQLFLETI